jgi:hypothetical protein
MPVSVHLYCTVPVAADEQHTISPHSKKNIYKLIVTGFPAGRRDYMNNLNKWKSSPDSNLNNPVNN